VFPATGIPAWSGRSMSVRRPSVAALPPVVAIPQELEEGGYVTHHRQSSSPNGHDRNGPGHSKRARLRPAQDELTASWNRQ
jgi:hypothetical protein